MHWMVLQKSKSKKAHKEFDCRTVNQIIAGNFYHQGLDSVGDCFVNEADESESNFCELGVIVGAIKERNLEPALTWAAANSDKLKEHGSDLELKLYRLQYMLILQKGHPKEAITYIKSHVTLFDMIEVQKLSSCLLCLKNLDGSPYSDLLSPTYCIIIAKELAIQFSNILLQSLRAR
ncbi:zinc ion binding [Euphorbia peplus]|nr:zinc ion binding [Euphorbia peplus]